MADKPVRSIDPLGIIALANILVTHGKLDPCSCEDIPVPCPCQNECSCEDIPVPCPCQNECSCENIPVPCPCQCESKSPKEDMIDIVSNPIFRQAVKGLDVNKIKTIEDFLSIVDEIRTKIIAGKASSPTSEKNQP